MLKKFLDKHGWLNGDEREKWWLEQSRTHLREMLDAMVPGVKYHTTKGILIRSLEDHNELQNYNYRLGPGIRTYYFVEVGDKYNRRVEMGNDHWSAAYNYKWPEEERSDNEWFVSRFHFEFSKELLSKAKLSEPSDLERCIGQWLDLPIPYPSAEEARRIEDSPYYEPDKDFEYDKLTNDPSHLHPKHLRNVWIQYAIDDYVALNPLLLSVISLHYASVEEFKNKVIAYDDHARQLLRSFIPEQELSSTPQDDSSKPSNTD